MGELFVFKNVCRKNHVGVINRVGGKCRLNYQVEKMRLKSSMRTIVEYQLKVSGDFELEGLSGRIKPGQPSSREERT